MSGSRKSSWLKLAVAIIAGVSLFGIAGASSASAPISAPLIAYWNGASWTQQVAPNPDGSANLTAVAAVSPSDVWAVGSYGYTTTAPTAQWFNALAEHWNGSSWQQVAMPTPANSSELHLNSATVISPSDIWAVGSWADFGPGDGYSPLIEHWNGVAWSIVPSPVFPTPVANHGAQLYSVAAVSADDVWAVGYVSGLGGTHRSLILHWDGTSWTRVPAPHNGAYSLLSGVTAISATKVWAVGTFQFKYLGHFATQPYALRWNGKVWQKMPNIHAGSLLAVTGTQNNIWAVGGWSNGGTGRALIQHWNGKHWQNVPVRTGFPESIRQRLTGVVMLPGNEMWAVGYHTDEHSLMSQTVIEHFSNGAWSPVESMNPSNNDGFADVAAASPTDVWAVGTYLLGG